MPLSLLDIEKAGLGVDELPREGRCLIARRRFPAGTTLLSERPITGPSAEDVARRVAAVPSSYALLQASDGIRGSLSAKGADVPFLAEVETNSFLIGGRVALFHGFAMLNHACCGSRQENACFSVLFTGERPIDESTDVGLIAVRDIEEGEPVRISYHELVADKASKTQRLKAHCGGNCGCSLCKRRGTGDDVAQFDFLMPGSISCQSCGEGSKRSYGEGDLVVLEGLQALKYNGRLARVRRRRGDGRLLVAVLLQGEDSELWAKVENMRPIDPPGEALSQCNRCHAIAYCSRECQRADWKEHKPFCGQQATWEADYAAFQMVRQHMDASDARQSTPVGNIWRAFDQAASLVERWTQPGRKNKPAAGHQALLEISKFAVATATLALGRGLTGGGDHAQAGAAWSRAAGLAMLHRRWVLAHVPRFHLAHWTILYHMHGLLSLAELQGSTKQLGEALKQLKGVLSGELDVVRVFDAHMAEAIEVQVRTSTSRPGGKAFLDGGHDAAAGGIAGLLSGIGGMGGGGEGMGEAQHMLKKLAANPEKFKKFTEIDASLPMEAKMKAMADLFDDNPAPPQRAKSAAQAKADEPKGYKATAGESSPPSKPQLASTLRGGKAGTREAPKPLVELVSRVPTSSKDAPPPQKLIVEVDPTSHSDAGSLEAMD